MAIKNPTPKEIEQILSKNEEVVYVTKNSTITNNFNHSNKVNNNTDNNTNSLNTNELKPKKSKFEPEPVKCQLISGRFFVPDQYIYVRRLNTEEEGKLTEIKDSETLNNTINSIFETAIKSNISINEMPLIDKMHVFAFILGITYGDKIQINDLIKCKDCRDEYPYNINFINNLKILSISDDMDIPFKVTLDSFDEPYEMCFSFPRIKNERNIFNKDISNTISELIIYLRDKNGVDLPRKEWNELLRWISNDDKMKIMNKLNLVNDLGVNYKLEINDCNNPNCCMKKQEIDISVEDLFNKIMNSIAEKNNK